MRPNLDVHKTVISMISYECLIYFHFWLSTVLTARVNLSEVFPFLKKPIVNTFQVNILLLYPLETSENQRFLEKLLVIDR